MSFDDKQRTPLSEHKFKDGLFTTPLNQIGERLQFNSWYKDRLPEYLWLCLIFDNYDRKEGLEKTMRILSFLKNQNLNITVPSFSQILKQEETAQNKIFNFIKKEVSDEILSPLTIIFPYSKYPVFVTSFGNFNDFNKQKKKLDEILRKTTDHQSPFSTDIRYLVVFFSVISNNLKITLEMQKEILEYAKAEHSDEKMKLLRPTFRSLEPLTVVNIDNKNYIDFFWSQISQMTECKPYIVKFEKDVSDEETKEYQSILDDIFRYFADLYRITNPLDKKMLVLVGEATYSYKRFSEITEYSLYNSISGRTIVRVLIEDYIMMKYLIDIESEKPNVWEEYQSYGIGQLKLIVERYRTMEDDLNESHVSYKYLDIIINDYINEEFLNMDTKYFNKDNIRIKAEKVHEKKLFDIYYDYDSSFEHGLWGAIRESTMIKCDAPGHQYHLIPDYAKEQKLKSIWHDAVFLMNRTVDILIQNYGISDSLKERLDKYEK